MLFLSYSFRFSNYIIIESGCRRRKRTSMMSESRGMYVFEPNMKVVLEEKKRTKIRKLALLSFRVPNQSQNNPESRESQCALFQHMVVLILPSVEFRAKI